MASLVLGIADVMGKYYVPKLGAFIVYVLMIAILLWRPQGQRWAIGGDIYRLRQRAFDRLLGA